MNITKKEINNFIGKYKKYKILYHITTYKNAKNILKNGFNLSKSKKRAFGKGINLTDNYKHLFHYYNKKNVNTVVVSLVKYNKLIYNPPFYTSKDSNNSSKYFAKHGHTKPTYMIVPKGYEGFKYDSIYVMKSKKFVFPLFLFNYKEN